MICSRRRFLAVLAGPAVGAPPAPPVVDTHIHIYDPRRAEGVPWPPRNDKLLYAAHLGSDFRAAIQGTGVTGAVIVEASPWPRDNDWILARAREDPLFLCVVGNIGTETQSFGQELDRLAKDALFRGIRIGGARLVSASVPNLKLLRDRGLALDVLAGPEQLPAVANLAASIRDLRIVVDHLPMYPSPSSALRELATPSNVFIKVSAVLRKDKEGKVPGTSEFYRDALDELWELFGPDRLVYGSNWPVSNRMSDYRTQLQVVREYFEAKGEAAAQNYFWKNAARLYRWPGSNL